MKISNWLIATLRWLLPACFIILLCNNHVLATAHTWSGGTSSDWNTASNWIPSSIPTSSDDVSIGGGLFGFSNQPSITSGPAAVAASITFGTTKAATLTVGTGYTLTTGAIVQKTAALLSFGTFTTSLTGGGAIKCSSITVGDNNSLPPILTTNLLKVVSTIANLHVTGEVLVNSTSFAVTVIKVGFNDANFSLQGGTTLIDGTILTTNTDLGILPLVDATPTFTIDMPSSSSLSPVLQLSNAAAINTASVDKSINFFNNTGGSGTSTVNYNGTDQIVYTSTTACLISSPQTYQYLTLSGSGTKTVGATSGGTLSIAKDFINSTTTTNLSVYNPTVSIGNNWINSGNVTGGSGNITALNLQNTTGTISLATGTTTIGANGIQVSGGGITCSSGTLTDNGVFQNSGGALICGSGSLIFNANYQNTGGTFTAGTGTVFFSGGTQSLYDNTTAGTKFRGVTFNGTGTSTISPGTGNFLVAANGTLTMTSPAKLVAGSTAAGGTGYLTLLSTRNSTATIAAISGSSTITGAVNVQRFVSGVPSTGVGNFRGYRLLSSPVNINNLTAVSYPSTLGYLGLNYLNVNTSSNAILTAGPGGAANGFSVANYNPLIYLYDESLATNNSSFVSGKNVGITAITGASGSPAYSVTTLSVNTSTAGVTIPVGNSILLYYVGSTSSSVITSGRTPDDAIATAVGYLNQGNIPVVFWKTRSTSIPFHTNGGNLPGLNQVGNPYASTISLDQLYTDNSAISPQFWELNDQTGGAYIAYNASSGATSNSRASKYIVSGQGFLIQATGINQTITFKEGQKTAYPTSFTSSSSPGALLLSMPPTGRITDHDNSSYASTATSVVQSNETNLAGLHLQLSADSLTNSQTGIYFSDNWSDSYNPYEDAVDILPSARVHLSSLSSDGSQLEINELGDYTSGKRIKLYVRATVTGMCTLSIADIANIDTAKNNIYLVDKTINDSVDMVRYKGYTFNITVGDTSTYGPGRFVLAIQPKPLQPGQLLSFTGQKMITGVQLNWQVQNSNNYKLFILQKLGVDNKYYSLYTIAAGEQETYRCVDQYPIGGNNTYRLQQTDISNNITYSAPVTIGYNSTIPGENVVIYPNPSKSVINVSLSSKAPDNYTADIYDTSGKLVKHIQKNTDVFTEDISNYKLGIYIIELKNTNGDLLGKSKFIKTN